MLFEGQLKGSKPLTVRPFRIQKQPYVDRVEPLWVLLIFFIYGVVRKEGARSAGQTEITGVPVSIQ